MEEIKDELQKEQNQNQIELYGFQISKDELMDQTASFTYQDLQRQIAKLMKKYQNKFTLKKRFFDQKEKLETKNQEAKFLNPFHTQLKQEQQARVFSLNIEEVAKEKLNFFLSKKGK